MVSCLVTSPFDQSRICSGDASEMRMALKLLTSSMILLGCVGERLWSERQLVLEAGEIDPAEIWQRIRRGVFREMDFFFVLVQDLDVEPQRLELLDQDLERLGHTGCLDVLAL